MNVHKLKMGIALEIENFIDSKLAEFARETGLVAKVTAKTCFAPTYDEDTYEIAAVDLSRAFGTWCHIDIATTSEGKFCLHTEEGRFEDKSIAEDSRSAYFDAKFPQSNNGHGVAPGAE